MFYRQSNLIKVLFAEIILATPKQKDVQDIQYQAESSGTLGYRWNTPALNARTQRGCEMRTNLSKITFGALLYRSANWKRGESSHCAQIERRLESLTVNWTTKLKRKKLTRHLVAAKGKTRNWIVESFSMEVGMVKVSHWHLLQMTSTRRGSRTRLSDL